MKSNKKILTFLFLFLCLKTYAEDGYDLWLRYKPVTDAKRLAEYKRSEERRVGKECA